MKTNEKIVLAIDFGTQSLRVSLVNNFGEIKAIEKRKYDQPYFSVKPGYAEQHPEYYWEMLCEAVKGLKAKNSDLLNQAIAFSVTTFRDSAVLVDENFVPTRPMILWLDQRQAELHTKLPLLNRLLFKLVGMKDAIRLNQKRTPAIWVQENEKEVWAKTKYYMNFSTYIMHKLTGTYKDSVANQTGHFPIHFSKGKWYGEKALKNIYQIPNHMLPEIVKQGEVLGVISDKVSEETGIPAGLKLYAAGTDKGSEAFGTGCYTKDYASISYGTASSICVTNKKYHEPETFLPAYAAPVSDMFNMEVNIYRGYWTVAWFIQQFGSDESLEARIEAMTTEEILNHKMLDIGPGSDGLILQPYWGPGLKRPEARGAIVGFSDYHTRIHIYRAIIEGIAFALREGLESIQKSAGLKVKEIRVSGGGSQSDAICQITADIFGIPVVRTTTYETATIGTSLVTFYFAGVFKTLEEATKAMVHIERTFVPNSENVKQYAYLFKDVYKELYPRLGGLYKKLRKLN